MADETYTIRVREDGTRVVSGNLRELKNSASGAAEKVGNLKGALAALGGAAVIVGIVALAKRAAGVADGMLRVGNAANALQMPIKNFSLLAEAARDADIGIDTLNRALQQAAVFQLKAQKSGSKEGALLKSLGIDPASIKSAENALMTISNIMSKHADDANKVAFARAALGRSGVEMIPFLNQGSEAIREQTERLEKMGAGIDDLANRKLQQYNRALKDWDRANRIVSQNIAIAVLPTLATLGEVFADDLNSALTSSKKDIVDWGETLSNIVAFGTDAVRNFVKAADFAFTAVGRTVGAGLAAAEQLLMGKSSGAVASIGKEWMADMGKNWDSLMNFNSTKARDALAKLRKDLEAQSSAGPKPGGRNMPSLNWADADGGALSKMKAAADAEITAMRELGRAYENLYASVGGYLQSIQDQIKYGDELTQGRRVLLEIERADMPEAWKGEMRAMAENAVELEKQLRLRSILAQTPTGQLEKQRQDMLFLADAYRDGALSVEQYYEAVVTTLPKVEASLDEMTEFAKQAARNMQDAMADGFFNIMQGKFDDLAGNFKQTIDRMVANLLASQLMNFLTGDFGKTGQMGGVFGNLFKNLLPSYDVGTDFVPRTGPAIIHRGERIVPAAENRPGATGVTVVNNFTVQQPADRRTQEQIAALAGASIQTALARGA